MLIPQRFHQIHGGHVHGYFANPKTRLMGTGLALVALAHTGPRSETIDRAIEYLRATLPGVRAAESLGWGLLGLRAWGEPAAGSDRWLAESYARVAGRPDAAPRLALLLLAAGDHALELFDAK